MSWQETLSFTVHVSLRRINTHSFIRGIDGKSDNSSLITRIEWSKPGVHQYFCSPHQWMTGFVIVDGSVQNADMQQDDEEEQDDDDEDDDDNE